MGCVQSTERPERNAYILSLLSDEKGKWKVAYNLPNKKMLNEKHSQQSYLLQPCKFCEKTLCCKHDISDNSSHHEPKIFKHVSWDSTFLSSYTGKNYIEWKLRIYVMVNFFNRKSRTQSRMSEENVFKKLQKNSRKANITKCKINS